MFSPEGGKSIIVEQGHPGCLNLRGGQESRRAAASKEKKESCKRDRREGKEKGVSLNDAVKCRARGYYK